MLPSLEIMSTPAALARTRVLPNSQWPMRFVAVQAIPVSITVILDTCVIYFVNNSISVFIVVFQEHAQEEHKKLLESITTMLAKSLSQRTELVSGHLNNRNQLSYCTTSARCMHSASVYSRSFLFIYWPCSLSPCPAYVSCSLLSSLCCRLVLFWFVDV